MIIWVFCYLQNNVLELREEASEFRSEKIRKDNRISQLELTLSQKSADIQQLSDQIKKVKPHPIGRALSTPARKRG